MTDRRPPTTSLCPDTGPRRLSIPSRGTVLGACLLTGLLVGCAPEEGAPASTGAEVAGPEIADTEIADTEMPEDDRAVLSNRIRWSTASEIDSFGYDIYRGSAEEGPFERINPEPVPGSGTSDEENSYQWIDDTIEADTAYWYYVESIDLDGTRERFTPIFRAGPKSAEAPPADGETGSQPASSTEG